MEEFFQLFKTPWEMYCPGRNYDVVIADGEHIPRCQAKLLLIYGASSKPTDQRSLFVPREPSPHQIVANGEKLPIYGDLLTFEDAPEAACCLTLDSRKAGFRIRSSSTTLTRVGYDLFEEVRILLSLGQPVEQASIPTLDIHIKMLRNWILGEGIPLVEVPPVPAGHSHIVCLSHDIDFVGIRNHKFDHTMWGFLYRSTIGSIRNWFRRRISLIQVLRSWWAVASLPFVYLGWIKDFWEPFEWYLEAEKGLPSTYFLIPFPGRAGVKVPGPYPSRRAAAYDLDDLAPSITLLKAARCELGVHGIDSWNDVDKGRTELAKLQAVSGESTVGIRMHWLLQDSNTMTALERSGYAYDSTSGYNETIGYRNGTTQVFRPLGVTRLLEVPLHIQDGALFYPQRLDLSESQASIRCRSMIDKAVEYGGVLTILWHDRSHGPERFWGDFYVGLVGSLRSSSGWFATTRQAADWFRKRREAHFEGFDDSMPQIRLQRRPNQVEPSLTVRFHFPKTRANCPGQDATSDSIDIKWDGESNVELDRWLRAVSERSTLEHSNAPNISMDCIKKPASSLP